MNEIVNMLLLAGDKFMPEMHKRGFTYSACRPKEFKNLKKQETQNLFIEINQKRLAFNMIWLMEILKI